MIHPESLWAINSRCPDQPDHPIYLFILFQLIPNFLNNQLFIYIFGCGVVFACELHCRRWSHLHPVARNHCLSIEMKGIALTLLNITLMCLIHCFSMFFAQLNRIKIDRALGATNLGHTCVHRLISTVGKSLLGKVYIILHRKIICTFEFIKYIYLCISVTCKQNKKLIVQRAWTYFIVL